MIEVNDDNEPAPKNVPASEDPLPSVEGVQEKPTHCLCHANRWDHIAKDNNGFQLFCMCLPEEWIIDIYIPMTNKELLKKTNLQELYFFIGCIFIWLVIPEQEAWWSVVY